LVISRNGHETYRPAVGYLRRSTDRQEQSIGDQRKAIEHYALEQGFELLDFYVDDAISGTTAEQRKAFLRLIEDASAEKCPFRYVLVYDIKRFGRLDNDEAGYYRFQLRRSGVEIVYVSEGFNGDDTDDLLRPVKQWQARQECKDLSRVTIRGLLTRCNDGWWNGGTPPYGYDLAYYSADGRFLMTVRYESDCSKLVLDEDGNEVRRVPRGEAINFSKRDRCRLVPSARERVEVVRNIFRWYTRDGLGFKGIADRLNREAIPSPRGGQWSSMHGDMWAMTTIRSMLANPAYVGDLVWNRLTSGKFHRVSKGHAIPRRGLPGSGPEHNRPDDWIIVRDAHSPLVSRTVFEEAQRKKELRGRGIGRRTYRCGCGATSPYLLTGLIHCLHCGHRWQGYTSVKGRRRNDGSQPRNYYYACNGYVTKGNTCCQRSVIPKDLIEGWVLEQIGRIVHSYLDEGGEARLRQMIEQEMAGASRFDGSALAVVRQHKADIEATIENLIDNITPTNREFVDRRIEKLRDELVELERQEAALAEQQHKEQHAVIIAQEALAVAQSFDRLVEAGTVDEKRVLVRAFLRRIDFDPQTRAGKAYFWVVPSVGQDDFEIEPVGHGRRKGVPAQALTQGHHDSPGYAESSHQGVSGNTRYTKTRRAAQDGASSHSMVAGAC
jgi:DNA invertase Pin-like site-specific DNA recombinase